MNRDKKKLYRKENKRALHHRSNDPGSEYRYERHAKAMNNFEGTHKSIKKTRGGYDYTPLYMFLLSKVGQKWNDVHAEAISRLDSDEHIWYMVILDLNKKQRYRDPNSGIVRLGDNAQYHSLTVNEDGILVKINPEAKPYPASCSCHTHTFNGKVLLYKPTTYSNIKDYDVPK